MTSPLSFRTACRSRQPHLTCHLQGDIPSGATCRSLAPPRWPPPGCAGRRWTTTSNLTCLRPVHTAARQGHRHHLARTLHTTATSPELAYRRPQVPASATTSTCGRSNPARTRLKEHSSTKQYFTRSATTDQSALGRPGRCFCMPGRRRFLNLIFGCIWHHQSTRRPAVPRTPVLLPIISIGTWLQIAIRNR